MRPITLALLFCLLLVQIGQAQTADAQIHITLYAASGSPLTGQVVQFVAERGPAQANCITNAVGTCTIPLVNIPTDRSGFIRGTLELPTRGARPLLWPAGPIAVPLTLKPDGTLQTPVDILATRTPVPANSALRPHFPTAPRQGVAPTSTPTMMAPPAESPNTPLYPPTEPVASAGIAGGIKLLLTLLTLFILGLGWAAVRQQEHS